MKVDQLIIRNIKPSVDADIFLIASYRYLLNKMRCL